MYDIEWESKARKQLAKIDGKATRDELYDSAERLSDLQNVEQVKKLTNHKYGYRLRVGRYRVFFDVDDSVRIIYIEEVKKRDDRTY
jgi:mRNA-degrading endonuclease RelE of RelBE toxin-antitoxin system